MPARSPFVPIVDNDKISSPSEAFQPFTKALTIEWSMIVFTLLLVSLRLYIRIRVQRQRSWSDALVAIGWMFFFAQGCMDIKSYKLGAFKPLVLAAEPRYKVGTLLPHPNAVTVLKLQYVSEFTYYWTIYGMKASMLVFLYGLIPRSLKKTWVMLHVTIVFTTVGFVFSMGMPLLFCRPISGNWSLEEKGYCDAVGNEISAWIAVSFHIISDLMIYILPFPVLNLLALTKAQKFGVGFIFALGFLCIAFALSILFVVAFHGWGATAFILCIFEQTWAISVVCAPAFKVFISRSLRRHISPSRSIPSNPAIQRDSESRDAELGLGFGRRVSLSMARVLKRDDDVVELISEGMPRAPASAYKPYRVYEHVAASMSTISKLSKDADDGKDTQLGPKDAIFSIEE